MTTGYEHDFYMEHKELVKAIIVIARELKRLNDNYEMVHASDLPSTSKELRERA